MLAHHSARRVETRCAERARRSWSAQLRRCSDSVAAATPSQLRRSSAARSIRYIRNINIIFNINIAIIVNTMNSNCHEITIRSKNIYIYIRHRNLYPYTYRCTFFVFADDHDDNSKCDSNTNDPSFFELRERALSLIHLRSLMRFARFAPPPFVIPIAQLYVTSLQTSRREMTTRRESDDEWFEPCRQAHG